MAKTLPGAYILFLVLLVILPLVLECSTLSNGNVFINSNLSNISDISTNEIIFDTTGSVSTLGGVHLRDGQEQIQATLEGTVPHAGVTIAACQQSTQETSSSTPDLVWNVPAYAQVLTNATKKDAEVLFFKLVAQEPYCGNATNETIIPFPGEKGARSAETIGFRRNGYLTIGRDFYNTDEYCVNKILDTGISIKYCVADCSESRPCVHKCLPPDEVMGFYPRNGKVAAGQFEFSPKFYKFFLENESSVPYDDMSLKPHFIHQRPKAFDCRVKNKLTQGTLINPYSQDVATKLSTATNAIRPITAIKFRAHIDSRVLFQDTDEYNCPKWRELVPGQFCIDGIRNVGKIKEFTNHEDEMVLVNCSPQEKKNEASLIFGIVMIVSSVFLLMTVMVYCFLWHQQNIHGWTIMAHATTMFFNYIFLGISHITVVKFPDIMNTTCCYLIGVFAHFFFLSTFCWLSLISFNLWWTFRSITPAKSSTGFRMMMYLFLGWGIPGIYVLLSIFLDLSIGNDCTFIRLPKYALHSCYVYKSSLGVYVYYPIAVLLVCNMAFFCMTLFKLYYYKKNTNVVAKNPNQNQLIALFAKLFFVVGVTWIFEFFSWLHVETQITWYWAIIDMINVLQSLAIFIIYVCKQDIRDSLEKAYPRQCRYILGCWRRSGRNGGRCSGAGAQPSSANDDDKEEDNACQTKTSTAPKTP